MIPGYVKDFCPSISDQWEDWCFRIIASNEVFVDLGAWIGVFSFYASDLYKKVYAIEPDPVAFGVMDKNVTMGNVVKLNYAIYSHDGEVDLSDGHGNSMSSIYGAGKSIMVKCKKFSTFMQENKIGRIDCLKIDIEGAEIDVIEDILNFNPTRIILSYHQYSDKYEWMIDLINKKRKDNFMNMIKKGNKFIDIIA